MKTIGKLTSGPEMKTISFPQGGRLDPFLGRIDLIAILTTVLGACLLGGAAVILTVIELVKLVSSLWSNPFDRWLIMAFGLTVLWVVVRWRKLSVF
jgi:hypothetical protein